MNPDMAISAIRLLTADWYFDEHDFALLRSYWENLRCLEGLVDVVREINRHIILIEDCLVSITEVGAVIDPFEADIIRDQLCETLDLLGRAIALTPKQFLSITEKAKTLEFEYLFLRQFLGGGSDTQPQTLNQ